MGLPLVAIAKLNLLLSCRNSTGSIVTCLILPFLIKLSLSYRRVRGTYSDFVFAFRLFFFQLSQIAARADRPAAGEGSSGGGANRWQRAIRLVYRRVREATRSPASIDVEDSLHTLSMLAL